VLCLAREVTCNRLGLRVFEIILALGLMSGGTAVLLRALKGKVRRIMLFRVFVYGNDANLGAGIFASILLLLGVFLFVAAIFRLDC
jgi:hypothetical protein